MFISYYAYNNLSIIENSYDNNMRMITSLLLDAYDNNMHMITICILSCDNIIITCM